MVSYSIIIPSFNRSTVLPRTIASVLNQSVTDWELIIVDDGSTDDTVTIVTQYLEDKRVKYLRQANEGAGSARNSGLKVSVGTWIIFLDSDDELLADSLKHFLMLKKNNESIFYGGYLLNRRGEVKECEARTAITRQEFVYGNPIECLPAVFFKREVLVAANGFDTSLRARQDAELYYRLSKETSFFPLPFQVCMVHLDGDDRIGRNPISRYHGWLQFYRLHSGTFSFSSHLKITRKLLSHACKVGKVDALFALFFGWWSFAFRGVK